MAFTYTIKETGGIIVDASGCVFNSGEFLSGTDSHYYDRDNEFGGGATFTYGTRATRIHQEKALTSYFNGSSTAIRKDPNSTGEIQAYGGVLTKTKAGTPSDSV